jgi:hypothetical protein
MGLHWSSINLMYGNNDYTLTGTVTLELLAESKGDEIARGLEKGVGRSFGVASSKSDSTGDGVSRVLLIPFSIATNTVFKFDATMLKVAQPEGSRTTAAMFVAACRQ